LTDRPVGGDSGRHELPGVDRPPVAGSLTDLARPEIKGWPYYRGVPGWDSSTTRLHTSTRCTGARDISRGSASTPSADVSLHALASLHLGSIHARRGDVGGGHRLRTCLSPPRTSARSDAHGRWRASTKSADVGPSRPSPRKRSSPSLKRGVHPSVRHDMLRTPRAALKTRSSATVKETSPARIGFSRSPSQTPTALSPLPDSTRFAHRAGVTQRRVFRAARLRVPGRPSTSAITPL